MPQRILALLSVLFAVVAGPAQALTITPYFDSSITSLPNAAAVKSSFDAAASVYDHAFSDPVTVNIGVSWGSVAGFALPSNALGASIDALYGQVDDQGNFSAFSYSQVKSFLSAAATTSADHTAIANLPATPASGLSGYLLPGAETKALGLIPGRLPVYDGFVGFAGTASAYSFTDNKGVKPGTYDFTAVAAHEIDEVLGHISGLASPSSGFQAPFDLFRYAAPGVSSYAYDAGAYFSIDGGATNLQTFNNQGDGDRGDWLSSPSTTDVQDAFTYPGLALSISPADLTALDVLGYTELPPDQIDTSFVFAPEPASLALLAFSLTGIIAIRRRRR